jgi:hypothetical protein
MRLHAWQIRTLQPTEKQTSRSPPKSNGIEELVENSKTAAGAIWNGIAPQQRKAIQV